MGCPTTNPLNKLSLFRCYPEWANQCGASSVLTPEAPRSNDLSRESHRESSGFNQPMISHGFSYGFLSSITIFPCFFQPMIPSIFKGRLVVPTTSLLVFSTSPDPVYSTMVYYEGWVY